MRMRVSGTDLILSFGRRICIVFLGVLGGDAENCGWESRAFPPPPTKFAFYIDDTFFVKNLFDCHAINPLTVFSCSIKRYASILTLQKFFLKWAITKIRLRTPPLSIMLVYNHILLKSHLLSCSSTHRRWQWNMRSMFLRCFHYSRKNW